MWSNVFQTDLPSPEQVRSRPVLRGTSKVDLYRQTKRTLYTPDGRGVRGTLGCSELQRTGPVLYLYKHCIYFSVLIGRRVLNKVDCFSFVKVSGWEVPRRRRLPLWKYRKGLTKNYKTKNGDMNNGHYKGTLEERTHKVVLLLWGDRGPFRPVSRTILSVLSVPSCLSYIELSEELPTRWGSSNKLERLWIERVDIRRRERPNNTIWFPDRIW